LRVRLAYVLISLAILAWAIRITGGCGLSRTRGTASEPLVSRGERDPSDHTSAARVSADYARRRGAAVSGPSTKAPSNP